MLQKKKRKKRLFEVCVEVAAGGVVEFFVGVVEVVEIVGVVGIVEVVEIVGFLL